MTEIIGRQPWYVPFTLWAGPIGWALVLVLYARPYIDSGDWPVHALGLVVLGLPMLIPYRRVTAVRERIVARHYLGRSVALRWAEIRKVEIESFGDTLVLRLIPSDGRKIAFSSKLRNFNQLLEVVMERTGAPIVRKPSA